MKKIVLLSAVLLLGGCASRSTLKREIADAKNKVDALEMYLRTCQESGRRMADYCQEKLKECVQPRDEKGRFIPRE